MTGNGAGISKLKLGMLLLGNAGKLERHPEETLNTWWDYSVLEANLKVISVNGEFESQKSLQATSVHLFKKAAKKPHLRWGGMCRFILRIPNFYLFPH